MKMIVVSGCWVSVARRGRGAVQLVGEPVSAVLDRPVLVLVVDVDQSEARFQPGVPLEVVQQRPAEVAVHRDTAIDGRAYETGE